MATHEAACSRIPTEIWRQIFRDILGSSLNNLNLTSLREYHRCLALTDRMLLQRYARLEKKRGMLRLVSRYWKDIADQMTDDILFVHPETGFRLPPNLDIPKSKCIYFLSKYSYILQEVSSSSLHHIFDHPLDITEGESGIIRPILHAQTRDIIVMPNSPLDAPTLGASVHALNWFTPNYTDPVTSLKSKIFKDLVALNLHLVTGLPQSAQDPALFLPKLRYLCLRTSPSQFDILSESFFPSLRFLELDRRCDDVQCGHVKPFLLRHATTIEELYLWTVCVQSEHHTFYTCLKDLPRLQVYIIAGIEWLPYHLDLISKNMESHPQLILQLESCRVADFDVYTLGCSLSEYRNIANTIVIEMWDSWEDMEDQLSFRSPFILRELLDFTQILDIASIRMFDSEGNLWGSEKANSYVGRLRKEIENLDAGVEV